jgi:predicted dehydrogenase
MADATFRLGIIGAGGISNAHSGAVQASGGRLSVTAVVDPSPEAREKLASGFGAQTFADVKALFAAHKAKSLVDGVVVCTPPSIRIPIVELALKHGVPVLSEKPLAHNLGDAKKLAALAKKYAKVPSFVGYCHRFTPAVNRMIELVSAGKIGRLVRFENAFACDLPGHEGKWFSDPKKAGGGAYLDMGSHSADLYHFVVGPAETLGAAFDHKWKKRTETAATVLLRSTKKGRTNVPAGVAGVVISGWAETSRFTVALFGDAGMLAYDYEKPDEIVFKDLVGKAESLSIENHGVRFQRQLEAFADVVQKKTKKSNLATFADGLAAAALDAKARKLAK